MKLRIRDNSLRFRLLRTEVEALAEMGRIESHILLSATNQLGRLSYMIEHADHYRSIGAAQVDFEIRVTVPSCEVLDWAHGDVVGIYGEQQVYGGEMLTISIEKDFACIDRSDVDNTDTFDNPNAQQC